MTSDYAKSINKVVRWELEVTQHDGKFQVRGHGFFADGPAYWRPSTWRGNVYVTPYLEGQLFCAVSKNRERAIKRMRKYICKLQKKARMVAQPETLEFKRDEICL